MPRSLRFSLAALLIACAAPLRAQTISPAPADSAAASAPAAPTDSTAAPAASANVAPVGFHYASHTPTRSDMSASRANMGLGKARALMFVGAAGILVGAIAGGSGGTVIMLGSAVIGLVGLYEYMQ